MRVTILTVGSRGDVQPYAALARGLMDAGHDVTLATLNRFDWLADALSVPMRGLQEEPFKALQKVASRAMVARPMATWSEARECFLRALTEWSDAVQGAEFLLAHPKIFVAPEMARHAGIPVAFANTLPVLCPTKHFPCCYVAGRPRGAVFNRASYEVLPLALAPMRKWSVEWFEAHGRWTGGRGRVGLYEPDGAAVPHLHGHSERVLATPPDWSEAWRTTGYWRTAEPADWAPEAPLGDFLAAGSPPVLVSFGSMVFGGDRSKLTREIVAPLLARGERVLLVRGWALSEEGLPSSPDVYFMDDYEGPWHSWLFTRCRAVVHHGGPGTFGAALHAGLPQLCCPFAMDQPFWARRSVEMGVAPPPLPMKRWSADQWSGRIDALLGPEVRGRARALSEELAEEDGIARAVIEIERIAAAGVGRPT